MREDVENILLIEHMWEHMASIYEADMDGHVVVPELGEAKWVRGTRLARVAMWMDIDRARKAVVECLLMAAAENPPFEATEKAALHRVFNDLDLVPYSVLSNPGDPEDELLENRFSHPDVPSGVRLYAAEPEYVGRVPIGYKKRLGVAVFNPRSVVLRRVLLS